MITELPNEDALRALAAARVAAQAARAVLNAATAAARAAEEAAREARYRAGVSIPCPFCAALAGEPCAWTIHGSPVDTGRYSVHGMREDLAGINGGVDSPVYRHAVGVAS